jgi:hypothetical protein
MTSSWGKKQPKNKKKTLSPKIVYEAAIAWEVAPSFQQNPYFFVNKKKMVEEFFYQHFRFKSLYGPAIQVQTLNGFMEINSLGCK